MSDVVRIERKARVVTLTLNRPDRLNAVSRPLYEALIVALAEADTDPEVRCVVLTGEGRAFCAGADLKAHADGPPDPEERSRYIDAAQEANALIQEKEYERAELVLMRAEVDAKFALSLARQEEAQQEAQELLEKIDELMEGAK